MKNKKLLNYMLIGCSALSIFCLGYYFYNFHHMSISNKTSDWSNFGSYVAGTVGPLLSLVSVLFIIRSINATNDNHNVLMAFSNNDKIVNQIKDLSDTLKQSLKECELFQAEPGRHPYGHVICRNIAKMIPIKDDDMKLEEVAISACRDAYFSSASEIQLILKLIKLLKQLNPSDHEVYKAMLEVKLTNEERAVLYSFACKDHPNEAALIHRDWPTFRGVLFE
ncbi:hypothetical protein BFS14_22765 [Serratia fonticola]|uniref:hypothetical protein n=1 Tax=Serratia fonticola TaxID=47917 RepID=UPI0008FCF6BF|nr:hypothetical protein [Serratia fonticola]OIX91525.1 hypothetical protein BFS14_22765 [Serratia fonticola]QCR63223.1 hypothetical protein FD644_24030 [Serratia fonticola]